MCRSELTAGAAHDVSYITAAAEPGTPPRRACGPVAGAEHLSKSPAGSLVMLELVSSQAPGPEP